MIIRFLYKATTPSIIRFNQLKASQLNKLPKRWSGHNAMVIEPSNFAWKKFKDLLHFYTLIGLIPVTVISTIINIRANPELIEIPEGYEPRHWEYYKHPITRFLARYIFAPPDIEEECDISLHEQISEQKIISDISRSVHSVMSFYNDHRSQYFTPFFAEYVRQGRDFVPYAVSHLSTNEGHHLDLGYQPSTPVPVEGYKPKSMDASPK